MFREMGYIYALYQERSFTRAAQKLNISQPTLSSMVKKAERKIGIAIFDRSTNPVSLTEAGEYYIQCVETIMQLQHDAERHFQSLINRDENCLRLGSSFYFLSYVLPPIAGKFTEQYGQVEVSFVEGGGRELLAQLEDGEIDFFLEVGGLPREGMERHVWGEERMLLAVPAAMPLNQALEPYRLTSEDIRAHRHLSDEVPAVDLSFFADARFILLRVGNDGYTRAVEMCRHAGFTPGNVFMTTDQMLTSYYLALEGHGAAFVRDGIVIHADPTEDLVFYKLDDPLATRKAYLYHRPESELSGAAAAFLQVVQSHPDIIKM